MSTNLYRLWGSNMQRYREAKGVTRTEMAKAIGSTEATLSRWENGIVMPDDERKLEIAAYLGIPPVAIFPLVKVPS